MLLLLHCNQKYPHENIFEFRDTRGAHQSQSGKKNSPKLLLDEQIWKYLAKLLREQGFDVIHVIEVELDSTPDEKIMAYAAGEHRTVVTFNISDFVPLAVQ